MAEQAFLFDLDGTLVDSVYQHVLAWHEALEREGSHLAIWRVHRRIGLSGHVADAETDSSRSCTSTSSITLRWERPSTESRLVPEVAWRPSSAPSRRRESRSDNHGRRRARCLLRWRDGGSR